MNKWRLIIIIWVIVSLALILASALLGWETWNSFPAMIGRQAAAPSYVHAPELDIPAWLSILGALITLFLSGLLVLYALPAQIRRMEKAYTTGGNQRVRLLGVGILSGVLIAAVGVTSSLTMGTFPLMIFLGSLLFLGSYIGYVALTYSLGHQLLIRAGWDRLSPVYALILGTLLLFAAGEIPGLGLILNLLFACLGLGVMISTRFGSGRTWSLSPLFED